MMEEDAKECRPVKMNWYIAKCPSGSETGVIAKLKEWMAKLHVEENIGEFVIPYDKQPTNLKRRKGSNMVNYVFIELELSEKVHKAIEMVKTMSLMTTEDLQPIVVPQENIQAMLNKITTSKEKENDLCEVGENVKITTAPFAGFNAIVEKTDAAKGLYTVSVPILGRQISVEVPFSAVKKAD